MPNFGTARSIQDAASVLKGEHRRVISFEPLWNDTSGTLFVVMMIVEIRLARWIAKEVGEEVLCILSGRRGSDQEISDFLTKPGGISRK